MAAAHPIFASERTAAALLDMKPAEFRRLVDIGCLPTPCAHDRWDVSELIAIMRGAKVKPREEFDL